MYISNLSLACLESFIALLSFHILQVFKIAPLWSYVLGIGPPAIYLLLCFLVKSDTQIYIASIATGFYSIVMMAVLIGTVVEIANNGVFGPSGIFFCCK